MKERMKRFIEKKECIHDHIRLYEVTSQSNLGHFIQNFAQKAIAFSIYFNLKDINCYHGLFSVCRGAIYSGIFKRFVQHIYDHEDQNASDFH